MFEALLHLIGPFWEIILVVGSGLALLAGTYLKGLSHGDKRTEAKFHKADREGAKDARKTADQIFRDTDGVGADELLARTDGLRD